MGNHRAASLDAAQKTYFTTIISSYIKIYNHFEEINLDLKQMKDNGEYEGGPNTDIDTMINRVTNYKTYLTNVLIQLKKFLSFYEDNINDVIQTTASKSVEDVNYFLNLTVSGKSERFTRPGQKPINYPDSDRSENKNNESDISDIPDPYNNRSDVDLNGNKLL